MKEIRWRFLHKFTVSVALINTMTELTIKLMQLEMILSLKKKKKKKKRCFPSIKSNDSDNTKRGWTLIEILLHVCNANQKNYNDFRLCACVCSLVYGICLINYYYYFNCVASFSILIWGNVYAVSTVDMQSALRLDMHIYWFHVYICHENVAAGAAIDGHLFKNESSLLLFFFNVVFYTPMSTIPCDQVVPLFMIQKWNFLCDLQRFGFDATVSTYNKHTNTHDIDFLWNRKPSCVSVILLWTFFFLHSVWWEN